MPKEKQIQNHETLKCAFPPDEALRRAMLVKPPIFWKTKMKATRNNRRTDNP
jgi:hypothetical protein